MAPVALRLPGRLTAALVAQLGLPAQVSHVLVSDRGLSSRQLVRDLRAQGCHSVTRLRRNTVVYTPAPPPAAPRRGHPRKYGDKYRVDALDRALLTPTAVSVWVDQGWRPATAWRGTFWRTGLPEMVELVIVQTARRAPWYLQATDPTLTTAEIVAGYHGRHAIEPAIHEANALGLDRYHGRTARGVRRWPLPLCLAHSLLALAALGALPLDLPSARRGGACSPRWRRQAFSCPKGGWAKPHRKSGAPHRLYETPQASR